MEAIFAQSIDLTYVGPNPALNAHLKSRGQEIRIIAGSANGGAALAPVNGYEDHGHLPPDVAFGALRRIADAVTLPVTADLDRLFQVDLRGCPRSAGSWD